MNDTEKSKKELHLLRVFLRASQSVSEILKRDMATYDLNWKEFTVLELLYNSGSHPTQEIGEKILLPSSSLTYVLQKLEQKECIIRKTDDKDRRITHVDISDKGREVMQKIFPDHVNTINEVFSDLSDSEIAETAENIKSFGLKAQGMAEKLPK